LEEKERVSLMIKYLRLMDDGFGRLDFGAITEYGVSTKDKIIIRDEMGVSRKGTLSIYDDKGAKVTDVAFEGVSSIDVPVDKLVLDGKIVLSIDGVNRRLVREIDDRLMFISTTVVKDDFVSWADMYKKAASGV
jgi:hypothetical protein